jgi:hypothetical protein
MAVTWKQIAFISDDAYGDGWNGVVDEAPSKNAVYDKMETKAAKGANSDITSTTALTQITRATPQIQVVFYI